MEREPTFGTWLRHRRRQLDLTQTALAALVGYSVVTIRKVERDELRPSKQLAERLAQGLEITLEQQASVIAFARSANAVRVDVPPVERTPQSRLPLQLTPFFGRTAELLELGQILDDPGCRLLSMVGPGGIGKTRLALEIAQAQAPHTPDGLHFVSLAPLRAVEHIVLAIAEALSFQFQADNRPPQQQLLDYLRPKQLLLVLDNFEHLLDGAELIQALLENCPRLRLLVTSRERLHLSSETVFTVQGMDFPTMTTRQETLTYSAVQLFVTTARRNHPKFLLDNANAEDIVHICRLVGGIPLAIILAAAWGEVLSPQDIASELSQGVGILEAELRDLPDRHRSMKAVLAQSWQRLTQAEQAVFMRLSLFRGGFTRQAAESVAGASLHTISSLIKKSLVQRDADGRYVMHELLRQYAEAELEAAGQSALVGAAHSSFYTGYLQARELDLKGRRQVDALDEIEADFENVRAAWQWAVSQRDYAAIGVALESLYWFCEMRSRLQEGLALVSSAREQLAPLAGEAPHPVWGQLLSHVFGQDFRWFESPTESRSRIETALALAQKHMNQAEIAFCYWRLATAILLCDDAGGAIIHFEQSIAHYSALGDRFYLACLQRNLGLLYMALDQSHKGHLLIAQSVESCRATGDLNGLTQPLALLGWFIYNDGRFAEAEAHWQEARELSLQIGARYALISIQLGLAWLALFDRGDFDAVRDLAEELPATDVDSNDSQNHHRTLIVLGFLAGMLEEYQTCHQCFQDAIALFFPYFPYMASLESMGMCLAACGVDDVPDPRPHLQKVLAISLTNEWPANAAKALTFAAILMAKAGKPQRASELLGLVFHHPLSPKGWLTQWPLITRLRCELEATLTPARFAAAWKEGAQWDLMTTAAAVMAELAEES